VRRRLVELAGILLLLWGAAASIAVLEQWAGVNSTADCAHSNRKCTAELALPVASVQPGTATPGR
jgi:hypothetical protein